MNFTAFIRPLLGAFLGGLAGFSYYRFVGCRSGMCPLTSNPYISVIYGMTMGAILAVQ